MNLVWDPDLVANVSAQYNAFSTFLMGKEYNSAVSISAHYLQLKMNLENCSLGMKFYRLGEVCVV